MTTETTPELKPKRRGRGSGKRNGNVHMRRHGYLPVRDVCLVLDRQRPFVHRLIQDGAIDGLREGRVSYVKVDSLARWAANPALRGVYDDAIADLRKRLLA